MRVTFSYLQISPKTRSLILWTERGAAHHAKMLDMDQAWEVFEKLEDSYFTANKQLPEIKSEYKYRYHVEITITDRLFGNNKAIIKNEAKDLNCMITGFAKL